RIARDPLPPPPPAGTGGGSAFLASAALLIVLVGGTAAAIFASARSGGLSPTIGRTVLATAVALAIFVAMAAAFVRARGRGAVRDTRPAGLSGVAPAPTTVIAQDAVSHHDAASEATRSGREPMAAPPSAPVPTGADVMFDALRARSVGAGIAEGRGGYPGGDHAPGWPDYVAGERATLAAYDALVAVHGEPKPSTAAYFRSVRVSLPDDERLLGRDGTTHVDLIGGRLQYNVPVSPWRGAHVRHFLLRPDDLAVLRANRQRRATLEVLTRLLVEHRRAAGGFSELDFTDLMRRVLHGRPDGDAAFAVAAETGADVDGLIRAARAQLDRDAT
ncbi:hypothetical protein, partial [Sphingomonas bacterium]|uniref:hypothetical protein n=1 Tax=Sphingomonas bacterium TaxID=1895847 RepID=UPI001C2D2B89